jgi:hypothetical protein
LASPLCAPPQTEFSTSRVATVDVTAVRQPVTQLEAIPDLRLLLALSDGALTLWELGSLRKRPSGGLDTKSALFFSLNVRGPPKHKLCVVSSKKRLRLYTWDGAKFVWWKDLELPDVPRAAAYYGSRIVCGYQR